MAKTRIFACVHEVEVNVHCANIWAFWQSVLHSLKFIFYPSVVSA